MEGILKRKVSIFRGYQDKWFTVTADGLLKQYEVEQSARILVLDEAKPSPNTNL